jgi:hypothetical protein
MFQTTQRKFRFLCFNAACALPAIAALIAGSVLTPRPAYAMSRKPLPFVNSGGSSSVSKGYSATFALKPAPSWQRVLIEPVMYAQYGDIGPDSEKARNNGFARELRALPSAQGYIVTYGGRRSSSGVAQERADRTRSYLVSVRGVDPARIVTVDGGFREAPTTELWIVPAGATPPMTSPTVDPRNVRPTPMRRRTPSRPRASLSSRVPPPRALSNPAGLRRLTGVLAKSRALTRVAARSNRRRVSAPRRLKSASPKGRSKPRRARF